MVDIQHYDGKGEIDITEKHISMPNIIPGVETHHSIGSFPSIYVQNNVRNFKLINKRDCVFAVLQIKHLERSCACQSAPPINSVTFADRYKHEIMFGTVALSMLTFMTYKEVKYRNHCEFCAEHQLQSDLEIIYLTKIIALQ
jgi:hypothetical protein